MDRLGPFIDAFDYLDIALAVVGALFFAFLFGRGKSPTAILSGAAMGGLIKPMLFTFVIGGAYIATQQTTQKPLTVQDKAEQDKIVKFWTQGTVRRH